MVPLLALIRAMILVLFVLFGGAMSAVAEGYKTIPLPAHLQGCLNDVIAEFVADSNRASVQSFVDQHVDKELLGPRVWGNDWKKNDQAWRDATINKYMKRVVSVLVGVKAASIANIGVRLAKHPVRIDQQGQGDLWQIALDVTFKDGRDITATAVVTGKCMVVEF